MTAQTDKALSDAMDATIARSSDRVKAMTTPPNAPEVDVLQILRRLDNEFLSRRATPAECIQFHDAVVAVEAMLTREAALVAERASLLASMNEVREQALIILAANKEASVADARIAAERDALAAEVGALREDAELFQWMETHVAAWHCKEAALPRFVVDPRFADETGEEYSLIVTGVDGVGTVSLRTAIRMMSKSKTDKARAKAGHW